MTETNQIFSGSLKRLTLITMLIHFVLSVAVFVLTQASLQISGIIGASAASVFIAIMVFRVAGGARQDNVSELAAMIGALVLSQWVFLLPFRNTAPAIYSGALLLMFSGLMSWFLLHLFENFMRKDSPKFSQNLIHLSRDAASVFLVLIVTAVTFFNFTYDLTRSNENEIVRHEHFSDAKVIGRALRADLEGFGSNGALMGWTPSKDALSGTLGAMPASTETLFKLDDSDKQMESLSALNSSVLKTRQPMQYNGNAGLQGDVFAIINLGLKGMKFNGEDRLSIMRAISVFVTSLSIALLCIIIARRFGSIEGAFVFLVFLFSPWYGLFSANLYWTPFLWLWPMTFSLWRFVPIDLNFNSPHNEVTFSRKDFIILAGLIAVNGLTGLEFISCVLISACLPVIIVPGFRQKWSDVFLRGLKASFAAFCGLGLAIFLYLVKISFTLSVVI